MRLSVCFVGVALISLACATSGEESNSFRDTPCTNEATREAAFEEFRRSAQVDDRGEERVRYPADDEVQCRLRTAAITLDDMPDGWEEVAGGSDQFSPMPSGLGGRRLSSPAVCNVMAPRFDGGVLAGFRPGEDGKPDKDEPLRLVVQSLLSFADGNARRYLAAIRRSCASARPPHDDTFDLWDVDLSEDPLAEGDDAFSVIWSGNAGLSPSFSQYARVGDVLVITDT
jgi:hypothetical protein